MTRWWMGLLLVAGILLPSSRAVMAQSVVLPVICGAGSSTCALKSTGGGQLFSVYVGCTSQCWLMTFDTNVAPTSGSTTAGTAIGDMLDCIGPFPTGPASFSYAPGPAEWFPGGVGAGIYVAVSSTSCPTLTLSSAAVIHGIVQ